MLLQVSGSLRLYFHTQYVRIQSWMFYASTRNKGYLNFIKYLGRILKMPKKINYSELIKETLILTVAVAVIAAAVFFFLVPSHASVSSISGLGIVLSNFIPMPLSAITMILNVLVRVVIQHFLKTIVVQFVFEVIG